jgi:hypothetical protein
MKTIKLLFLTLLAFTALYAHAQLHVGGFIPKVNLTDIRPGDSVSVIIENHDTIPIVCYPLTVYDRKDSSTIFLNSSSFYNYVTDSGKSNQEQAILRIAQIIKSGRFTHTSEQPMGCFDSISGWIPESGNRRYSSIGFPLAFAGNYCGDFSAFAASVLVASGMFHQDSILGLSFNGHVMLGLIMGGDTAAVDFDGGQQFLFTKLPDGHFLSAHDIMTEPSKFFQNAEHYKNYDPIDGSCGYGCMYRPGEDTMYRDLFNTYWYTRQFEVQPVDVSGLWKIPHGVKITAGIKAPEVILYINDSSDIEALKNLQSGSFENIPVDLFSTQDIVLIQNALESKDMFVLNTMNDFDMSIIPYFMNRSGINVEIETGADSIIIGRDLQLPIAIHQIETTSPVWIGDTVYPVGTTTTPMYYSCEDDVCQGTIQNKDLQFFQTGVILPYSTVKIRGYINSAIYGMFNGVPAVYYSAARTR